MERSVNGRPLRYMHLKGKVSGAKSSSERVYGEQWSVAGSTNILTSEVTHRTSFWLVNGDHEREVHFGGPVSIRDGHEAIVVYVGYEAEEDRWPALLFNATTRQLYYKAHASLESHFEPWWSRSTGCMGTVLTLACLVSPLATWAEKGSGFAILVSFLIPLSVLVGACVWAYSVDRDIQQTLRSGAEEELATAAGFSSGIPRDAAVREVA